MSRISRRDIIKRGIGGAAAAGLAVAAYRGIRSLTRRPNVLLIIADDLRPQLGCYGKRQMTTPSLDAFAAQGTLFTRTFCQQPLCSPSRVSFLTGCRPDTTKVHVNSIPFRQMLPNVVTLPQHFKAHGYHTQAVGKILHPVRDPANPLLDIASDDQFSWSVPSWKASASDRYADASLREEIRERRAAGTRGSIQLGPRREKLDVPDNAYSDGQTADRAIETLGELKDRKFFLAVGFTKPHRPHAAPLKYWRFYPTRKTDPPDNSSPPVGVPQIALKASEDETREDVHDDPHPDEQDVRDEHEEHEEHDGTSSDEERKTRALIRGYYACVSFVDAQIGRVIAELDRLGLGDDTVVVVLSDHGFHLGENGQRAKSTLFTPSLHVPLIVRTPDRASAGKRTAALTELVDVYPSLCDLCGLPTPTHLEGTSFKPVLRDPDRPWKGFALSQTPRVEDGVMGYSMRTDRYRFNTWRWLDGSRVEYELYDHRTDPGETVNVAAENTDIVRRLAERLAKGWREGLPE